MNRSQQPKKDCEIEYLHGLCSRETRGRPRVSAAGPPPPPSPRRYPRGSPGKPVSPPVKVAARIRHSTTLVAWFSQAEAATLGGEAASTRSASGVRGCMPSSLVAWAARWGVGWLS
jgi:hypothetical protein